MSKLLRKHDLPNFKLLDWTVDSKRLLECFTRFENEYDSITNSYGPQYFSDDYTQMTITEPSSTVNLIHGKEDERSFDKLKNEFVGTYVEEVLSKFKSPYTRVRLIIKKPGSFVLPHKDYDTRYSVRYFIPLQTNPWAMTAIKRDEVEVMHLKEGNVYFVNVGFDHSAWNFGSTDDIRLIVSVNGQDDLNV